MKVLVILLSSLLLFSCSLFLASGPESWGTVTDDVLEMKYAQIDSSSSAVVLFDKAKYIFVMPGLDLNVTRHNRIRIFKESGKEFANIKIPYWHEDKISRIQAQTILPDGTVIKLNKKDIFTEGNPKRFMYKVFAIPGVTDNCIIEYKYSLTSKYIVYLDSWYFQHEIPTLKSSITVDIPLGLVYNCYLSNSPEEDYKPVTDEKINPNGRNSVEYTWEYENLPPIKDEPFMSTPKDYMCKLNFQLIEYKNTYVWQKFVKTWDDLHDKIMITYKPFLKRGPRYVSNFVKETLDGVYTKNNKIDRLYSFVRDSIETLEYKGLFGSRIRNPKEILKSRSGSRVEKNLLLVNLLNTARIKSYPCLISTRKNGIPDLINPRLDVFNHVLAYVPLKSRNMAMDAKSPYYPVDMLPPSDNVKKGLLIKDKEALVVSIPQSESTNKIAIVSKDLSIDENGTLYADSEITFNGYRNALYRYRYDNAETEIDFVNDYILDDLNDVKIDSISTNKDSTEKDIFIVRIKYSVPNFAEIIGDEILVPCSFISKYTRNIFTLENRTYPIDYNYERQNTEKTFLRIPEGYELEQLPENIKLQTRGHYFNRTIFRNGTDLCFTRNLDINKKYFIPIEYEAITDFYGKIVQADRDVIVLRKEE